MDPVVTEEVNDALTKSVSREEVQKAVFQMGALKAPGSDGFPGIFYQKYWDVVGEDVFTAVNEFFQNGHILKEMNLTNVALIPKVSNPESMSQFRPISLCRFNYKIVSKVLANRLQPFINSLITEQQSAFIPGRQIHDNVIVAHEVFHFLKRKKTGGKGYVAVKLNLNKAYDRVCWDFLFSVLQRMGFNETWIGWIKECVGLVKYSINANGEQVCNITPNRGLRQGDPLSPYLFLIAVNVFSSLMNKATSNKTLAGIRMKRKCPIVSHLLFTDDSLVFLEATPKYCSNFWDLISCFSKASGLEVNSQKSSLFFSPNTLTDTRNEIKVLLGMNEMDTDVKYLGLPTFWGRSKKESLAFVKVKIMRKIQGWNKKALPQASKEILIKSVVQAVPMYPMSCFKVPLSVCAELNSIIGRFWWENGQNGGKIHWGSWDKITAPKGCGGLGFRDFESFNCALLAKQYWRMILNPNAFWVSVLKGLYFPNGSCMDAKKGAAPSWLWSSLMEGKTLIDKGLRWSVGNGETTQFWGDNWIPSWQEGRTTSNPPTDCVWNKVSDFIDRPAMAWNEERLRSCVSKEETEAILKIPISLAGNEDKIIWKHNKSGKYTVKSSYYQVYDAKTRRKDQRPSSSRSIPRKVWTKLWSIPTIPKVCHFIWRTVRIWNATKENLFRRKCISSHLCLICGVEAETIEHVLFRCSWVVAVWFGSGLTYWVQEQWTNTVDKWVEEILCGSLAKEAEPEVVSLLFQTCWAIWKTRNDSIFNGVLPCPERTVVMASLANSDYLQAVFQDAKDTKKCSKTPRVGRWHPPLGSVIKFNCDGAFLSSHSKAAFGFLARDSGGLALFWRSGKVIASSALFTEAWALRIACGMAMDMGIRAAMFESDYKEVIACLTKKNYQCPSEIAVLVDDMKCWAAQKEWSFSWVYRDQNRVAHWLATNSLARNFVLNLGCILPGMEGLLAKDRPP